jgi:hypothetical protein
MLLEAWQCYDIVCCCNEKVENGENMMMHDGGFEEFKFAIDLFAQNLNS